VEVSRFAQVPDGLEELTSMNVDLAFGLEFIMRDSEGNLADGDINLTVNHDGLFSGSAFFGDSITITNQGWTIEERLYGAAVSGNTYEGTGEFFENFSFNQVSTQPNGETPIAAFEGNAPALQFANPSVGEDLFDALARGIMATNFELGLQIIGVGDTRGLADSSNTFTVTFTPDDPTHQIFVVPEPSAATFLLAAVLCLALLSPRRR
jgi:hypothetical protein